MDSDVEVANLGHNSVWDGILGRCRLGQYILVFWDRVSAASNILSSSLTPLVVWMFYSLHIIKPLECLRNFEASILPKLCTYYLSSFCKLLLHDAESKAFAESIFGSEVNASAVLQD